MLAIGLRKTPGDHAGKGTFRRLKSKLRRQAGIGTKKPHPKSKYVVGKQIYGDNIIRFFKHDCFTEVFPAGLREPLHHVCIGLKTINAIYRVPERRPRPRGETIQGAQGGT